MSKKHWFPITVKFCLSVFCATTKTLTNVFSLTRILFQALCLCHALWTTRHVWTQNGAHEYRSKELIICICTCLYICVCILKEKAEKPHAKTHTLFLSLFWGLWFPLCVLAKQTAEGDWQNCRSVDGWTEADEAASMCQHHLGGGSWYRCKHHRQTELMLTICWYNIEKRRPREDWKFWLLIDTASSGSLPHIRQHNYLMSHSVIYFYSTILSKIEKNLAKQHLEMLLDIS